MPPLVAAALVLCLSALAALTLLPSPPPPHDLLASISALFMSGAPSASASLAASLVAGAVLVLIFCDKAAIVRHVRSMLGYAAAATAATPGTRGQAADAPVEGSASSSTVGTHGVGDPMHRKRTDVVSLLSAPADTDDTDEDFVFERRKRKNGPNTRDSDSQVADDEDELTGTDATPAGTPSTARRAISAKGGSSKQSGGSSSGSGGGPASTSSNLTRRQKKNRKQGGDSGRVNGDGAGGALAFNNNGIGGGNGKSSKKNKTGSLQLYVSLNMSDEKIYEALERYVLSEEALRNYGFPVESSLNPGLAYVLSNDHSSGGLYSSYYEDADDQLENTLNPNAREFHPRSQPHTPKLSKRSSPEKKEIELDQQQSSIDKVNNKSSTSLASSASTHTLSPTAEEFVPKSTRYVHQNQQQQETGGDTNRCSSPATSAPTPTLTTSASAIVINSMSGAGESNGNGGCQQKLGADLQSDCVNASPVKKVASDSTLSRGGGNSVDVKRCLRCSRPFCVKDGIYLQPEACLYHWGKLRWVAGTKMQIYQCCGQQKKGARSAGCEQAAVHVWKGVDASDGPQYLESFVVTKMPKANLPSSVYSPYHPFPAIAVPSHFRGVYAMDAEMAFTAFGLELVRVTVVGLDGRLVYEAYVKPDHEIIDYNTRYSGLSQREHERLASKTLKEVQNDLMGFLTAKSMLVGHGLENDLRVLRLVHSTVIDTSIVFMEESGSAMRYSLKHLAKVKLGKDIQMSEYGHDSREDAVTSMELMLQRVGEDLRGDGGVTR